MSPVTVCLWHVAEDSGIGLVGCRARTTLKRVKDRRYDLTGGLVRNILVKCRTQSVIKCVGG
jgi:hypothetical protein